ncbi:iron-containing alcohol dehydrogenase family protein [Chitinispirillales bacterium ANBcel5]|uniref:iron-containing alcohol dehydrogenase family protein n=1 Tax=Cellulosispirillum alkaliphilum TaxID=3039283 RepID=UPI002A52C920|nr:iron-containing alcohol dehydrogenase family protein [Chitinispirillales bacterium ANBcel5]
MEISIPTLLRIKPNALHKIGKYLRKENFTRIAIFYGTGLKEIFNVQLTISFESSEISVLHQETVATNEVESIYKSAYKIPDRVQAIIAIGGGKAIDYCKYVAFILQLPIISVPTSISNDGFASPGASLLINGRRKSQKAKIPYGVVIDTEVIRKSPDMFTYSGIGDLLSKYTAIYDWKLAFRVNQVPVNDFAVLISSNAVEILVNYKNKNVKDLEFLRMICGSLVMSGIAMEVSGSSRPASGSEHLISHAYDMVAKKPSLHGIQVGVATYAVSWLQNNKAHNTIKEVMEQTGFVEYVSNNPLNRDDFIEAILQAPTIKDNYYTILSEKKNIDLLIDYVNNDSYLGQFLK